ncbi:lytic polysaccharide monooxygenase [Actinoplanes auranticolor]|uniref:lytic polysaccharide monooxygenase auxiliary activity family 9 protein n=1 Tax=Actinoplanes auranticolor TaxID=47988 RepID=UPI001BB42357
MFTTRSRRSWVLRALAVGATAAALVSTALAAPASAHGSVVDPPSRNYGCLERWGSKHLAPEMETQDPMCYQAWRADPNAMWNWNGLYRENVGGNHQAVVPDGQLCSGGRTQSGRYAAMDAVGNWTAAEKSNQFTLNLKDEARHGADYLRIYITRQGFNPLTQPLTWSSLELVTQTGRIAPAGNYTAQVNAGSRTGRHVVYTIWQASHLDQPYYICSDVNFSGR